FRRIMSEAEVQEKKLNEDTELRIVVNEGEAIVELVDGRAEIFGSELVKNKKYLFQKGSRIAIFTYEGATVDVVGSGVHSYTSDETPMVIYLNTHAALEQIRKVAECDPSHRGPRIMLVGPTDVGKSTVCRILCNYSVRMGRSPILVDLDVGQGEISVPGTMGAIFINKMADIMEGFDCSRPLVFNFGATTPSENLPLYDLLVKELAEVINQRCAVNRDSNIGGIIINTCGWVHGDGYQCLVSAAEAFEVESVVVIDHERLYNDLKRDLPSFVKILHQPKSGGTETRSKEMRAAMRSERIHRYFYGTASSRLNPYTFEVNFSDVLLAKIGAEQLPESCLPFGAKIDDHNTKVVGVKPSSSLIHCLLAISPSTSISQNVLKETVLGFVVVNQVNDEAQTLTILSPQQELPSKVLIVTSIKFVDDRTIE
ncbi:clpf-1, partial [Pristionchus pacificus]